jgi:hypothetical protein
MSPGARALFDLPLGACRWPSRHDLNDERFAWCGEPALPGKSYCERHRRRAYSLSADATDKLSPEIIEESGARYRLVMARGRNLGDRRQWRVVPAGSGARRRPPRG